MSIDYFEVMGILGAVVVKHPQTTSLLMQTYSLWNGKMDEINKINSEYLAAAAQARGPLDQAGIVLQLIAAHPNVRDVVKQTLTMWQGRIPDLIQILDELQAAASEAAKT